MGNTLAMIVGYLISVVEACGALVIVLSAARTIIQYLLRFFRWQQNLDVGPLRIRLGQGMVLGLEFQVAADILKTALSPEWNDILRLIAVIAVRTVLNYLLERELSLIDQGNDSAQRSSRDDIEPA